jgi:hypothetical protein
MRAAAVAFVLVYALATTTAAQSPAVRQLGAGRVTVAASDAPLGQLLRELAVAANVALKIDPAVEGQAVSLNVADVPVERALATLLWQSNVNFVAVGLERLDAGTNIRIVVGDKNAARDVIVASSAGPGTGAPPTVGSPAGSTREVEVDDDRDSSGADGGGAAAEPNVPGQVTPEEFLQALSSPNGGRVERRGLVMLPFAGPDGQPLVENVGTEPRTTAMLPFTDEAGRPMIVPAIPTPGAPVMLPFIEPDGSPVFVPAAPVVPARRPGR